MQSYLEILDGEEPCTSNIPNTTNQHETLERMISQLIVDPDAP
jgi:hypothetical protein